MTPIQAVEDIGAPIVFISDTKTSNPENVEVEVHISQPLKRKQDRWDIEAPTTWRIQKIALQKFKLTFELHSQNVFRIRDTAQGKVIPQYVDALTGKFLPSDDNGFDSIGSHYIYSEKDGWTKVDQQLASYSLYEQTPHQMANKFITSPVGFAITKRDSAALPSHTDKLHWHSNAIDETKATIRVSRRLLISIFPSSVCI